MPEAFYTLTEALVLLNRLKDAYSGDRLHRSVLAYNWVVQPMDAIRSDAVTDHRLMLRAMAAAGPTGAPSDRVFVLGGTHERRVHIRAQQDRGLNLADALVDRASSLGREANSLWVAVVGAGAGGLTCATRLALDGFNVLLIDEHEEPVGVQRWSLQRFLHPNLFDWPQSHWSEPQSRRGLLDWSAGLAANVRNQLVAQFSAFAPDPLRYLPQTVVHEVREVAPDSVRVICLPLIQFSDASAQPGYAKTYGVEVDFAVVATGFLPEAPVPDYQSGSYWRDDLLHTLIESDVDLAVPVIGDGDGGLSEVLRLVLHGGVNPITFHQSLLPQLLGEGASWLSDAKEDLLDIDRLANDRLDYCSLQDLQRLESLDPNDNQLKAFAKGRPVLLHAKVPHFRSNSFLANRYLVGRLAGIAPDRVMIEASQVEAHLDLVKPKDADGVFRIGPPTRQRTELVQPAVHFQRIARSLGRTREHEPVAGLLLELLDGTRRRRAGRSAGPVPGTHNGLRSKLSQLTVHLSATQQFGHTEVTTSRGGLRREDPVPSEVGFAALVQQCCIALGWLANRLTPHLGQPHWARVEADRTLVSTDLVATVTDSRPRDVVGAVRSAGPGQVSLRRATIEAAERLWLVVEVGEYNPSKEDSALFTRVTPAACAPATWDDAEVTDGFAERLSEDEDGWSQLDFEQLGAVDDALGAHPLSAHILVLLVSNWGIQPAVVVRALRTKLDGTPDDDSDWADLARLIIHGLASDNRGAVRSALLLAALHSGSNARLRTWLSKSLYGGSVPETRIVGQLISDAHGDFTAQGQLDLADDDNDDFVGLDGLALPDETYPAALVDRDTPRPIGGLSVFVATPTRASVRATRAHRARPPLAGEAEFEHADILHWAKALSASDVGELESGHPNHLIEMSAGLIKRPLTWVYESLFSGVEWREAGPETDSPHRKTTVDFDVALFGERLGKHPVGLLYKPERAPDRATVHIDWRTLPEGVREHRADTGKSLHHQIVSVDRFGDGSYAFSINEPEETER